MTTNQTIDGVPLLPCPLCRGKVRAPKCKAAGHACVTWTISCNCGVSYESDDEQGTIRGWNRRATPCSEAQDPPNVDGLSVGLYRKQPAPVAVVRCSFCDITDQDGNPWSGGSATQDGILIYRVIGCKDHKHLADACLAEVTRLNPSL